LFFPIKKQQITITERRREQQDNKAREKEQRLVAMFPLFMENIQGVCQLGICKEPMID
jgi:hypothetical protein